MIKLRLERKITDAKFRFLKRKAKRSEQVITDNPVWGKTITFKPIEPKFIPRTFSPRRPKIYYYDKNKPSGKKYPAALYEMNSVNRWQAQKLAEQYKKNKEFGKLRRLYKLCPDVDPKVIKEKEHQEAVKRWQAKLKANELIQHQNNRS